MKNGEQPEKDRPAIPKHPFDVHQLAAVTAKAARAEGYTQRSVERTIVNAMFHSSGDVTVSAFNYLLALHEEMGPDDPEQAEREIAEHAASKCFDLINEAMRKSGDREIPEALRARLMKWTAKDVAEERRA
jgi:hypothetical protein